MKEKKVSYRQRGKMQVEARISERVHSGFDPDPCEEMGEGKGKRREGEIVTESRMPPLQKERVTKMSELYRTSGGRAAQPLGCKVGGRG